MWPSFYIAGLPLDEQKLPPDAVPISADQDWRTGSFYGPEERKHRHLGSYKADGNKERREEREPDQCNKKRPAARRLTAGLLILTCPHNVVHGFTLLRDAESVGDIFQVLFTRYAERMCCCLSFNIPCCM